MSDIRSSPEYSKAFSRWVAFGESLPNELRILNETTNADGGFLPPTLWVDKIAEQRRQGLRGLITHIPCGSKSITIPYLALTPVVKKLGESPTLGSGGSYGVGSGTDANSFNLPNFGTSGSPDRRSFNPSKIGFYTIVTEELFNDSYANLEQFLAKQFAISIVGEEAKFIISGTGTGEPCGFAKNLLAESRLVNAATTNTITLASPNDLGVMLAQIDPAYIDSATWLMHPAMYARYIAVGTIAPYVSTGVKKNGAPCPTIYGFPVEFSSNMPAAVTASSVPIIFGDLSQYVITEAAPGYSFTRNDQGHIASGQIGLYARTRIDGNVVQPKAFVGLVGI